MPQACIRIRRTHGADKNGVRAVGCGGDAVRPPPRSPSPWVDSVMPGQVAWQASAGWLASGAQHRSTGPSRASSTWPMARSNKHSASAAAWRLLLQRAVAGRVYSARTTEVRARLGLASELTAMNRSAEAIDELQHVVDMHPIEPIGARERAERELRAAIARRSPP